MLIDITSLDVEQNFWELYPEFKVVEPFKSLYAQDKSKHKQQSSQTLWFVAICYAPSSSLSKRPKDGKDGTHEVVGEDFLLDRQFYAKNLPLMQMLIPAFVENTMTPMQRQLRMFERKLEEREAFIRDTPYAADNWKQLDDALKSTGNIQNEYKRLADKLAQESEEGATWGDQEESASEKGLI